jgi:hypothetical protein
MRKQTLKIGFRKKNELDKCEEKKLLNKRITRKKDFSTFETLGKASSYLGDVT